MKDETDSIIDTFRMAPMCLRMLRSLLRKPIKSLNTNKINWAWISLCFSYNFYWQHLLLRLCYSWRSSPSRLPSQSFLSWFPSWNQRKTNLQTWSCWLRRRISGRTLTNLICQFQDCQAKFSVWTSDKYWRKIITSL